jgi:hypothetical protein
VLELGREVNRNVVRCGVEVDLKLVVVERSWRPRDGCPAATSSAQLIQRTVIVLRD